MDCAGVRRPECGCALRCLEHNIRFRAAVTEEPQYSRFGERGGGGRDLKAEGGAMLRQNAGYRTYVYARPEGLLWVKMASCPT
jgi:hypothetical protein